MVLSFRCLVVWIAEIETVIRMTVQPHNRITVQPHNRITVQPQITVKSFLQSTGLYNENYLFTMNNPLVCNIKTSGLLCGVISLLLYALDKVW